jgi:hypothetical protein
MYDFGICRTLANVTCSGEHVVAAQMLGGACTNGWGRLEKPEARLLTDDALDGLSVTYFGPLCTVSKNKTATIRVECDKGRAAGKPTVGEPSVDECSFTVTIRASEGCPSRSVLYYLHSISWGWIFILVVAILLLLYCGLGSIYKVFALGASGIEAIPNSDLWTTAASDIQDGARIVLVQLGLAKPSTTSQQDVYRGLADFDEF